MGIATSWVKSATVIGGQDHLGTIAPAEAIYVRQLPGITNVTARAAYYSFYPWVLRELEQRGLYTSGEDLVRWLRRAECLFALVAIRHGRSLDEDEAAHGATMVGREKLVPASDAVSTKPIHLDDYADLDAKTRYFQNPLGGLGQYYFGALRELGILGGETRSRDIRYVEERGLPLAKALAKRVNAARFFEVLKSAKLSARDLDDLSAFCPCGLAANADEREHLIDLLVDPTKASSAESASRRSTIALVLDLAARGASDDYDFSDEFRAAAYTGALRDGAAWDVPAEHAPSMRAWSVFARHELLSVAFQGLFWAALTAVEVGGHRKFRDAASLASAALTALQPAFSDATWSSTFVSQVRNTERPALSAWRDEHHEIEAGRRIVATGRTPDPVTRRAVTILATLAARPQDRAPYDGVDFDTGYLQRYEINLTSFEARIRGPWANVSVAGVVAGVIAWAVRAHLRVAMQKMAARNVDTFKLRPLDEALLLVAAPEPTFSTPRIHRVAGLLTDLGLLTKNDTLVTLTPAGRKLHGALHG